MYEQPVFAAVEQRGGKIGIRLPDTDEWLSLEEAKVSPKCRNTIAWDDEHGPVPWRSKLKFCDIMALASIKKDKRGRSGSSSSILRAQSGRESRCGRPKDGKVALRVVYVNNEILQEVLDAQ